jgi:hypothetical protein
MLAIGSEEGGLGAIGSEPSPPIRLQFTGGRWARAIAARTTTW